MTFHLLLAGSDVLQRRVSEQRLKLSALLFCGLDHPGSGLKCVRLLVGRLRRRRLARSEIRFRLGRYDPIFAIEILLPRWVARLLVGDRTGFDPIVANREDFLADPLGLYEVGDSRRQVPGGLRRSG